MRAQSPSGSRIVFYLAATLVLVGVIFALTSGATRVVIVVLLLLGLASVRLWRDRRIDAPESWLVRTARSSRGSFLVAAAAAVVALLDLLVGRNVAAVLFAVLAVLFGLLGWSQRAEPAEPTADADTAPPNGQQTAFPGSNGGTAAAVAVSDRIAHPASATINVQFRWADGRVGNPQQKVPLSMLGLDRPPLLGALIRYAGGEWQVAGNSRSDVYLLDEVRG